LSRYGHTQGKSHICPHIIGTLGAPLQAKHLEDLVHQMVRFIYFVADSKPVYDQDIAMLFSAAAMALFQGLLLTDSRMTLRFTFSYYSQDTILLYLLGLRSKVIVDLHQVTVQKNL
jgi:hypothetical protein